MSKFLKSNKWVYPFIKHLRVGGEIKKKSNMEGEKKLQDLPSEVILFEGQNKLKNTQMNVCVKKNNINLSYTWYKPLRYSMLLLKM